MIPPNEIISFAPSDETAAGVVYAACFLFFPFCLVAVFWPDYNFLLKFNLFAIFISILYAAISVHLARVTLNFHPQKVVKEIRLFGILIARDDSFLADFSGARTVLIKDFHASVPKEEIRVSADDWTSIYCSSLLFPHVNLSHQELNKLTSLIAERLGMRAVITSHFSKWDDLLEISDNSTSPNESRDTCSSCNKHFSGNGSVVCIQCNKAFHRKCWEQNAKCCQSQLAFKEETTPDDRIELRTIGWRRTGLLSRPLKATVTYLEEKGEFAIGTYKRRFKRYGSICTIGFDVDMRKIKVDVSQLQTIKVYKYTKLGLPAQAITITEADSEKLLHKFEPLPLVITALFWMTSGSLITRGSYLRFAEGLSQKLNIPFKLLEVPPSDVS